ncbi:hypothetical protein PPERSA_10923 [Pseudocohnilembus persalinus]|uniref:ODAD1 central coiled coil region domain-containing protein n=1 Tax=Pseudocohnilembus persalinus TaxID=266149 RepID=A0A0V0R9I2_PSEPJ|nr:hypothetical protein PPERSA_10923 [Pseudocohnilembus persalinus]|eukprot:KRX11156.1 hypothetical protein PPERSA_10923 [Pseudocohnilembus persalinus]
MTDSISQSKMNKTGYSQFSGTSSMMGNDIESQKKRTVKKILVMSSMDQQMMKILLKVLSTQQLKDEQRQQLIEYSSKILDQDRQNELRECLELLVEGDGEIEAFSSDTFLEIIKYFVLSTVEKNYINKIEQELNRSETLENEIKDVQAQIKSEKQKKLERYSKEKRGETGGKSASKQTCESLLREISVHENKLEKSNQKLNEIVAQNNQLREKINVLRKEKVVIEDIYNKLKTELESKKKEVENTIASAGDAYYQRNRAEEELKALQEKAEKQKEDFEKECSELNKNIQYDRRFKKFIESKQKEKEVLENLEKQISKNKEIIAEKIKANAMIDNEYQLSAQKEEEIKKAFERIKKETGIKSIEDSSMRQNESKKLLEVFITLYQKNTIMTKFVKELEDEVGELEQKINDKKKGSSAITEENMMFFLGLLEEKGLYAIQEYAKLVAEQLKLEKTDSPGLAQQIDDLNNIIAYENANIMNYYSTTNQNKAECPEDILSGLKPGWVEDPNGVQAEKMSIEEMKKFAIEVKIFENLKSIQILNLGGNKFSNIDFLQPLQDTLEKLDISNNKIEILSDNKLKFMVLDQLNVSKNQINTLLDFDLMFPSLFNLDISHNDIFILEDLEYLEYIDSLVEINVEGNVCCQNQKEFFDYIKDKLPFLQIVNGKELNKPGFRSKIVMYEMSEHMKKNEERYSQSKIQIKDDDDEQEQNTEQDNDLRSDEQIDYRKIIQDYQENNMQYEDINNELNSIKHNLKKQQVKNEFDYSQPNSIKEFDNEEEFSDFMKQYDIQMNAIRMKYKVQHDFNRQIEKQEKKQKLKQNGLQGINEDEEEKDDDDDDEYTQQLKQDQNDFGNFNEKYENSPEKQIDKSNEINANGNSLMNTLNSEQLYEQLMQDPKKKDELNE